MWLIWLVYNCHRAFRIRVLQQVTTGPQIRRKLGLLFKYFAVSNRDDPKINVFESIYSKWNECAKVKTSTPSLCINSSKKQLFSKIKGNIKNWTNCDIKYWLPIKRGKESHLQHTKKICHLLIQHFSSFWMKCKLLHKSHHLNTPSECSQWENWITNLPLIQRFLWWVDWCIHWIVACK